MLDDNVNVLEHSDNDSDIIVSRLTTKDNPFDPFNQFDEWFQFDVSHNYNCCGLIDRIAKVSDEMTPKEYNEAIAAAIAEIIQFDPLDIYCRKTMPLSQIKSN